MDNGLNNQNVAIILHDLRMGGAERVMLQLAEALSKEGIRVDLILAHAEGALLSQVSSAIQIVDLNVNNPLMMLVQVIRYLRLNRPRALLSPFEVTSIVAVLAKLLSRTPTRVVVRLSVALSKHKRAWFKKLLERIAVSSLYRFADAIIAVSHGVARDFSSFSGISIRRIEVIYNPIISEQFLLDREQTGDHPLLVDDNEQLPMILGVGRLTEQKDFQTLIRAFDIVVKERPARLIIIGEGEDRSSLEALACQLNIENQVYLPGIILNPITFMKEASVFVLSSRWEGLPGALIQALASGCPVVSTDCPSGPSEILDQGKYGRLVPVGDAFSMAQAIKDALNETYQGPPTSWMQQYTSAVVIEQYKKVLRL
jgi:glycosyltransferase involved in cell wall biosynthesis